MLIKHEKNKITYVFNDKNIDFDFGTMVISQLSIPNNLSGKRSSKRGKSQYEVSTKDLEPLMDILPRLSILQNTKCLYDIFFSILLLEKQDLIKKQGLWCKYEDLYYDRQTDSIRFTILPVSEELVYEDGLLWSERLLETINFIAGYLPFNYKKSILDETYKYVHGETSVKQIIDILKPILEETEGTVFLREAEVHDRILTLIYIWEDKLQEYEMRKTEIVIGKNGEDLDLRFEESDALSRLHCKIIKQNQNFFIQDLDSLNHTLVNGEFVPPYELMELEDRDLLSLGDVELRVDIK